MSGPATAEEQALLAQLQERFREELAEREREGRLYPCFFGETALCRVLRGNKGNLEESCAWFERFLEKMIEYGVDDIVSELTAKLDECGQADSAILPGSEEVKKYFRFVFQAPRCSPDGDLVQYLPLVDQDKYGILEGLEWEHWVRFSRGIIVLLCLQLEQMSRAQRRMVKCVLIADLADCSMDNVLCGTFDNANDRDVSKMLEYIAVEIIGEVYVVNAPWAVTTLFNTFKMFIPAKFSAKFAFPAGDGLDDAHFVERAGGEEQLRQLYGTRVGLVTKPNSVAVHELDSLPTEKEMENITKLRERFQEAFAARESAGLLYPCFFGDIAMARVLRGNDGSLSESIKWFERFLDKANQYNIDRHYEHVIRRLDASGSQYGNLTMLPHYEEVQDYCRMVFTAPKPTPKGDVVQYIAFSDIDRAGIAENVDWNHWVAFMRSYMILRCLEAERLSRLRKRMVRCISIFDLEDCGMGMRGLPSVPDFDDPQGKDVFEFMQHICAEILGPNYVLNAPWVMVKAYNWFQKFVPEKFSRKLRLLDGNGSSDPDFVRAVGGEAQLKLLLSTRVGLTRSLKDEPSGTKEILPGHDFQKSRDVSAGQRVSWSCEVLPGFTDGLLGSSCVEFGVTAYWFGEDLSNASSHRRPVEEVIPPKAMDPRKGSIFGSCRASGNGVITLKWSNYNSMMRTKVIRYSIVVSDGDEVEDLGVAAATSSFASTGRSDQPEFQYFRFTPTKMRSRSAPCCQLCALQFRGSGVALNMSLAVASNPGGFSLAHEGPDRAVDGELSSKWSDATRGSLVLKFPSRVHLDEISFTTAADLPECDPLCWLLEGSRNGSTWALLHSQAEEFPMPIERLTASLWLRLAISQPGACETKATAHGAAGSKEALQVYRFTPTRLRRDTADVVQVSELKFRTSAGSIISLDEATVSNPGGLCEKGRGPRKLCDSSKSTEWADRNKMAVLVQFPNLMCLEDFCFTTAQDRPECDPIRWTLEGARAGGAWKLLHKSQDDYSTPVRRSSSTVWFTLASSAAEGPSKCSAVRVSRKRFEQWLRGKSFLSWEDFCTAVGPSAASGTEQLQGMLLVVAFLANLLVGCLLSLLVLRGRTSAGLAATALYCLALHTAGSNGWLPYSLRPVTASLWA